MRKYILQVLVNGEWDSRWFSDDYDFMVEKQQIEAASGFWDGCDFRLLVNTPVVLHFWRGNA